MKKLLILFAMGLFLISNPVLAALPIPQFYSLSGEALVPFSTECPSKTFSVKLTQDFISDGNVKFEKGTVINGKVVKVFKAKRAKLNAFFSIKITDYITPSSSEKVVVEKDNIVAKVIPYKDNKIDLTDTALSAGTTVAGFFVKNIEVPINFTRGAISSQDENASGKVKDGLKNAYEEINFKPGDPVSLNIKCGDDKQKPDKD